MATRLHLDFETYSEVDIRKVGGYAYAAHPSTEILLCAYAVDNFPVEVWDATVCPEPPFTLLKWLNSNLEIHAFNAQFERLILAHCMKQWIDPAFFRCTMVHAWSMGFSGGLEQVGQQIGLPEDQMKMKEGKKLITRFCKPAPSNHKADRYDSASHPDEWERFKLYCQMDVESERSILRQLSAHYTPSQFEQDLYVMDQRINDRGLPIDLEVVKGAVHVYHAEVRKLKHEMNELTGLSNANSIQQLGGWLEERGVKMGGLTKDEVAEKLTLDIPEEVRHILELRQQVAKTSSAKWEALLRATQEDGRLRGTFAFAGAQRTKRWAGRIFQPHNLPRPSRDDTDETAGILAMHDRDLVELIFGNVMQFLSDNLRSAVTAPPGKMIDVCDLSSIESRLLGWLSGCVRINNIFANNMDTYKDFATEVFHVRYEEVTKEQRHFSKPPVLGSGYGLGAQGLMGYAEGYGVSMDREEAQRITDLYREVYPEVPAMWRWLIDTCRDVITHNITEATGYGVTINRDSSFLYIWLPSGRPLAYYHPTVEMQIPPWERKKELEEAAQGRYYEPKPIPAVTYMGMDQYTKKWKRITTHGGKLTENICQAVARDILAWQMLQIERYEENMDIILHVHDEIGVLVPETMAEPELQHLRQLMSTTPDWSPGLTLGAEGFSTRRYKKD